MHTYRMTMSDEVLCATKKLEIVYNIPTRVAIDQIIIVRRQTITVSYQIIGLIGISI